VQGAGKGADGWFTVATATVAYDHPSQGTDEHALLIDFANYDLGTSYRVALELDLESGKALLAQLQQVSPRPKPRAYERLPAAVRQL
jgi:hypothetical protein